MDTTSPGGMPAQSDYRDRMTLGELGPGHTISELRISVMAVESHPAFLGTGTLVLSHGPFDCQVYPSAAELRDLARMCLAAAQVLDLRKLSQPDADSEPGAIPVAEAQDSGFEDYQAAGGGPL